MSISAMIDRAESTRSNAGAAGAAPRNLAKAMASMTAYFPTETVGTYVAVLAIIQPESSAARWGLYAMFLVFTAFIVRFYAWQANETTRQKIDQRALGWLLVLSLGSFTIWSAIMPWSPFVDITDEGQRYAAVAAIIVAPILPMAAQMLRLSPPWR